ncbi:hypothetical protein Bbelb_224120 [Branchiostoma belcheri]|nr:hypothetical protein Bbelb_224120 [Branchiostoma belcheri]
MEAFDNGFRTGPYRNVRPGPEPVIERYRGPACHAGYTQSEDHCLKLYDLAQTWRGANSTCTADGGFLAAPKTEDLQQEVLKLVEDIHGGQYWIGLAKTEAGQWEWPDGAVPVFTAWAPGEPNNAGGREDCGELWKSGWNDAPCGNKRYFICQTEKGAMSKCQQEAEDQAGRSVHEEDEVFLFCESDGTYSTLQCDGRDVCYCAHPHTGALFRETEHGWWDFWPEHDCDVYWMDKTEGPENQQYTGLGCWTDTSDRAIPILEGTDPRLDGPYQSRQDAIQKCYQVAQSRGFTVFAVQNGGQCFGSANAFNTYNRYGPSTACAADGEGGPWANEVYQITEPLQWRADRRCGEGFPAPGGAPAEWGGFPGARPGPARRKPQRWRNDLRCGEGFPAPGGAPAEWGGFPGARRGPGRRKPQRWRADGRCGEVFPAPGGGPAECDPDGPFPCCSPYHYCGSSEQHCNCPGCTDYRLPEDPQETFDCVEGDGPTYRGTLARTQHPQETFDCVEGDGSTYRGTLARTESGRTCQRWDAQWPHYHGFGSPLEHPELQAQTRDRSSGSYVPYNLCRPPSLFRENYCRNPDGEATVWCYTTDPYVRWEHCDLPDCDSIHGGPDGEDPGSPEDDCQVGDGSPSVPCLPWDGTYGLTGNYCRNPDGEVGVWCFVDGPAVWELCDVPVCGIRKWLTRHSSWVVSSAGTPHVDNGVTYDAAKVLDGDSATYWNPRGMGRNYNNWYIILDLTAPQTVTRIAVTNFGDTIHDIAAFRLQNSLSASPYTWEDVKVVGNVQGGTSQRQEFGGFQGTARYWRFVVTRTHSGWQPWLSELDFYGTSGTGSGDVRVSQCAGSTTNIARGRSAQQSSQLYGKSAERAVDGNLDGDYYGNSCTHTDMDHQPWWRLDLGASKCVDRVVVTNRMDCCSDRLDGFKVGRIPNRRIPNRRIPNGHIPNRHIPNRRIPNRHIPNRRIPDRHIPNRRIPNRHIPDRHIPNRRIPNTHIPNRHIPNRHIPDRHIPNRHIPNWHIPNRHIPNRNIPKRHIPKHIPNTHIPNRHIPNRHISNRRIPNRHIPNTHIPDRHIPNRNIPNRRILNRHILNRRIPNRRIPNRHISNRRIPNRHIPNTHIPNIHILKQNDPSVSANPPCGDSQSAAGRETIPVACGGLTGRYVGIALPGRQYLTLCEVQVFGGSESSTLPLRHTTPQSSVDLGVVWRSGSVFGPQPRGPRFEPHLVTDLVRYTKGTLHDFPHFTQVEMNDCLTRVTGSDLSYRWDLPPLTSSPFTFEVKANSDVHIALSNQNSPMDDMYEIVIGGWENSMSVIRRKQQGDALASVATPDILSPYVYRGFLVSWAAGGAVSVRRETETDPFLTWTDPDPLPVSHVGYSTGYGSTGTFIFCPHQGVDGETEECMEGDGETYRGTVAHTVTGLVCQPWDSHSPHAHYHLTPFWYPQAGLDGNFCRNPDGSGGPWCYTMDPDVRWEYCDVPTCDDGTGPGTGEDEEGVHQCKYGAEYSEEAGRCECPMACPLVLSPVCGSDGKEHSNECVMIRTGCQSEQEIHNIGRPPCPPSVLGSEHCEAAETDGSGEYHWDLPPLVTSPFPFEVRAGSDVYIALSAAPGSGRGPTGGYRVLIGGEAGTYRGFWLSWAGNGTVAVGREGETDPVLQWRDPDPVPVKHVGYSTGQGVTADFRFCGYYEAKRWREDARCGADFPAPGATPGECDPKGPHPCCSALGWCGDTDRYCSCDGCVDYRQPKAPEQNDCQVGDGSTYRGEVAVTSSGRECQRWDSDTPHFRIPDWTRTTAGIRTASPGCGATPWIRTRKWSCAACPRDGSDKQDELGNEISYLYRCVNMRRWPCSARVPGVSPSCTCCSYPGGPDCRSPTAADAVRDRCEGRRACSVPADHAVFGDPCFGVSKYLLVKYGCVGGENSTGAYSPPGDDDISRRIKTTTRKTSDVAVSGTTKVPAVMNSKGALEGDNKKGSEDKTDDENTKPDDVSRQNVIIYVVIGIVAVAVPLGIAAFVKVFLCAKPVDKAVTPDPSPVHFTPGSGDATITFDNPHYDMSPTAPSYVQMKE